MRGDISGIFLISECLWEKKLGLEGEEMQQVVGVTICTDGKKGSQVKRKERTAGNGGDGGTALQEFNGSCSGKPPTQLPRSEICHSYLTTGEPPAVEEEKDRTRKLSHYRIILKSHLY